MFIQDDLFLKGINQKECTKIFFDGQQFYQGIVAVEVTYCRSAVDFPLLAKKDLLWQKPPLANFCTEFCRIHAPLRHVQKNRGIFLVSLEIWKVSSNLRKFYHRGGSFPQI
jgi:hypothetical protein